MCVHLPRRRLIKGPIYSGYIYNLRFTFCPTCGVPIANEDIFANKFMSRIFSATIAKEVFICWLSQTRMAGLISECSPNCTSRPRRSYAGAKKTSDLIISFQEPISASQCYKNHSLKLVLTSLLYQSIYLTMVLYIGSSVQTYGTGPNP